MGDDENYVAVNVIEPDWLQQYEAGMSFFFSQLVQLNVNIFIVDRILAFPLELLVGHEDSLFLRMVVHNFIEASILTITRLVADNSGDTFTLQRFKNSAAQHIVPKYREKYRAQLETFGFDKATRDLLERVRKLRNMRIAHLDKNVVEGTAEAVSLDYGELRTLRDLLNSLLDSLSINTDHMMLPVQYDPGVQHPAHIKHVADIDAYLESLARSSHIVNLPEKKPHSWANRRKVLSESALAIINQYRGKFGLPPA